MISAAYESLSQHRNCMRAEERTNLFVMAKLAAGGSACTVKVRNISAGGAMVEGAALPPPGTPCRLLRGNISIEAQVIWLHANRVGLQFRGRAEPKDWLPSGQNTQSDVDQAVAQAKAELSQAPIARSPAPLISTALAPADVAQVADTLEILADELADDPVVVAGYLAKLQTFDIAVQTLRKLAVMLERSSAK
ncbi:PilZ domain-containing protein [Qipengyuania qiaonensis]|uniref:PilZ domain-containing protein n=1 Tax=Qipengyuania qiaonensis TaxID=2867240 RepID=A0ABS7J3G2_9SPHN|nr:PilZ domain-containing protein [Qipengyuania qiaonensis]MBX7481869.1 PilZ domain-containing protein [Qipengyuania qiaonensis]